MAVNVAETVVAEAHPEAEIPRTADNPAVVSAIQKHLDAFTGVETPAETKVETVVEETVVEETVVEKVEKVEETPAKGGETEVEETVIETEEAVALAASTLPAAYVRTAKARGWSDQEIVDFHKGNPDLALKTFERMHGSRTEEIKEWADLGRKLRTAPAVPAVAAPLAVPAPTETILAPIDVAAMVEQYGNEDLIKALAGPVNAAIAALQPIVQNASAAHKQAQKTQQDQLGKVVADFFGAKDMTLYAEVYGKNTATLKDDQFEARRKVLETADALLAGAAYQGRQLSVQEALLLAHDSTASGAKETIIRNGIAKNVQKRAKGITLKPTAKGREAQGGAPKDRQELLSRTEDRLANAFG